MMETYRDKTLSNTKINTKQIEFDAFVEYLNLLDKCKYKCDAQKVMDSIINKTNDDAQVSTLKRIVNNKLQNVKQYEKNVCPHCSRRNHLSNTDDYVICGYTNKGFDWNGCGKDWCNCCSKKLCKQWGNDSLFNVINRIHTNKCCKKHATKNGADYLGEYCQCKNKYYKINK